MSAWSDLAVAKGAAIALDLDEPAAPWDNSASLTDAIAVNTPVAGQPGLFAGSAGSVLIDQASDAINTQVATGNLTDVSVEIRLKTTSTQNNMCLLSNRGAVTGWKLGLGSAPVGGGSAGMVHWGVAGDGVWNGKSTNMLVNDGVAHHIVATYKYPGTGGIQPVDMKIYVDGVQVATTDRTYQTVSPPLQASVPWGTPQNVNDGAATGNYEGVAVYAKELTAQDVNDLYNAAVGATSGNKVQPVGQALETDTAQRIGHRLGVRQVVETDTAQPIGFAVEPFSFKAPRTIVGDTGTSDFDLTNAFLETGEPNPHTATKTAWALWTAPDEPPDWMRFTLTGSTADTTMTVYTGTTLTGLTQVVTGDGADDPSLVFAPVAGTTYRIQIGVKGALAPLASLTWMPSESASYDTFATPLVVDGKYGSTQVTTANGTLEVGEPSVGVAATSWLSWVAPSTEPVSFQVEAPDTETTVVHVYTGAAVNALTQVTTASGTGPVTVTWTPVAGTTYYVRVGTMVDVRDFEVAWSVLAAPVTPVVLPEPPAPESYPVAADPMLPRVHLRVEVYDKTGQTLITEVPRRFGVNGQEPLNEPGSGSLMVPLGDPILEAYPTLFDWGNVVKFWLGGTCISAFEIRRRRTRLVDTGEHVARVREVAGPTVHHWLRRFMVVHDGPARPDSLDVRYYSWASKPGEWYNDADWGAQVLQWTMDNPPSNKKKNKPRNWKVRAAKWIRPQKGGGGWRYLRKNFEIGEGGTLVRLFATADEWWRLYLDGELIMEGDRREVGYTEFKRYDTVLAKGQHTLAALARSMPSKKGDGNDSFLFAMCEVDLDGKIIRPALVVSNDSWKAHVGNPPPGWNRALVLRNVVLEARQRNVEAASWMTLDFTGTTDTGGQTWNDRYNQEVQIGTSGLDLQAQLSEGNGFDVWLNPDGMKLQAWRRRGTDKSTSVTLEPGRNLLDWEVDETDEVENDFLIQYDGGWTRYAAEVSKGTYTTREAYVSLNGVKDEESAERLIRRAAAGIANAQNRAGTGEIKKRATGQPDGGLVGVEGAYPFLDFGVGDTVKAPNANGVLVKQRVLALTFIEDANGNLTFDPDLEEIRSV